VPARRGRPRRRGVGADHAPVDATGRCVEGRPGQERVKKAVPPQPTDPTDEGRDDEESSSGESTLSVVLAFAANALVGVLKLVAGLLTRCAGRPAVGGAS